jgi:hypothetical protein
VLWRDENGEKRTIDEARLRYEIWRQDAYYGAVPALWRVLRQMSDDRFLALSQFLRHPAWEAANNGAERNRPWYTLAEISWPRCRPPRHRIARGLPSPQAGSPRSRRRPQTANVSVPRCTSPFGLANRQQFAGW